MVIELQTSPGSINFGRKDTNFSRKQAASMAKKTPKAFYPAFGVHTHVTQSESKRILHPDFLVLFKDYGLF